MGDFELKDLVQPPHFEVKASGRGGCKGRGEIHAGTGGADSLPPSRPEEDAIGEVTNSHGGGDE
eukprot:CAMPEP_0169474918 /NCGR_PEP_ID=MMETSP1042-20121227/26522_1 /TAXON_ID=464988 /ORGANISM="Hemiselmis andersenii, Strain CCMP1180" /LENGTH=63 /DNA_ID=CAMNT_0009588999 /DNA_START=25 /DNA_END=213 /DNA_ORIENTATION=-